MVVSGETPSALAAGLAMPEDVPKRWSWLSRSSMMIWGRSSVASYSSDVREAFMTCPSEVGKTK